MFATSLFIVFSAGLGVTIFLAAVKALEDGARRREQDQSNQVQQQSWSSPPETPLERAA